MAVEAQIPQTVQIPMAMDASQSMAFDTPEMASMEMPKPDMDNTIEFHQGILEMPQPMQAPQPMQLPFSFQELDDNEMAFSSMSRNGFPIAHP
jgi:hypothetical protein